MHTSAGRKKGRGLEHFLNEGASVRKERFQNDWEERGMAFALGDEISEEEKERRRLEKEMEEEIDPPENSDDEEDIIP